MIVKDNNTAALQACGVETVGVVGAGTIGSGWAAHFLSRGLDVIATDPSPKAEKKLRSAVDNAWPSLEQLGLAKMQAPTV